MRLTGLVMFITVVFHLLYMHMVVGVENITFDNIDSRWSGPAGVFWRLFDASLLFIGMAHGMNGGPLLHQRLRSQTRFLISCSRLRSTALVCS